MKYHTTKMYGAVEVQVHASTLALHGCEWSASHLRHFTLG